VIRIAELKDNIALRMLYERSIYHELPELVSWAMREIPERILIVDEQTEIAASVYTMTCGYGNLWASYLAFQNESAAKNLIDHLLSVRNEKSRNLYILCPMGYMDIRIHLIARGFIPECVREIDGLVYIVESYNGSFRPRCESSKSSKPLSVTVREGKDDDQKVIASLLHDSLPRDFPTIEDSARCIKKWLGEMREYTIVVEHNNLPIGVLLISPEIHPVSDKKTAMICYIAVEKRFRNRGVGKTLIEGACDVLREAGKRSMEVDVSVHNVPARIFYTKLGFYPFWISRNYMPYDDGIFYRIDF